MSIITLEDGRKFPEFEGEALAWSVGLYMTLAEEGAGYPRARAVLAELDPERLETERREMVKASFCRIFGHNAKKRLRLIEAEIERRA